MMNQSILIVFENNTMKVDSFCIDPEDVIYAYQQKNNSFMPRKENYIKNSAYCHQVTILKQKHLNFTSKIAVNTNNYSKQINKRKTETLLTYLSKSRTFRQYSAGHGSRLRIDLLSQEYITEFYCNEDNI